MTAEVFPHTNLRAEPVASQAAAADRSATGFPPEMQPPPPSMMAEPGLSGNAPTHEELDFASAAEADFNAWSWEPLTQRYGIIGLLRYREAMLPIPKPTETGHLKFLICPSPIFDDRLEPETLPEPRDRQRGGPDRKGKGKGKEKPVKGGGRFIQDMGTTQVHPGSQRGQWWRNVAADRLDVIIREQFSLASTEIWKVPAGHYVAQGGPCEVFISGQATGLQRMPVLPRGWATVDASAVGGPKYLEPVRTPRWKVVFSSGSNKGDIVVRDGVSLESDEVAVLLCGTHVDQCGPQELLEDGIIRMPIVFAAGVGREPSSASQPPKRRTGWVTCDATSQGGPKFFEPCPEELEPPRTTLQQGPPAPEPAHGGAALGDPGGPGALVSGGRAGAPSSWDKNRLWKVVHLEASAGSRQLPMVSRAEPYAPGTGRVPPEDVVVRWLQDGDVVEQVGHSKKMRGYMVMPVRFFLSEAARGPGAREEPDKAEGWVTRRLVDKSRDHADMAWFEELRGAEEHALQLQRNQLE